MASYLPSPSNTGVQTPHRTPAVPWLAAARPMTEVYATASSAHVPVGAVERPDLPADGQQPADTVLMRFHPQLTGLDGAEHRCLKLRAFAAEFFHTAMLACRNPPRMQKARPVGGPRAPVVVEGTSDIYS